MNTSPEILDDEEKFLPRAIQDDSFLLRGRWYLLYGVALFVGSYWVTLDQGGGIFRVPTHWVGLRNWAMWIEIPFMLTGIFIGVLVSLLLLRRYYKHWFKALLFGGMLMALASLLSWGWVFKAFFNDYAHLLPKPPIDMQVSHFYVSVFYFLFYMSLVEILIYVIVSRMKLKIRESKQD